MELLLWQKQKKQKKQSQIVKAENEKKQPTVPEAENRKKQQNVKNKCTLWKIFYILKNRIDYSKDQYAKKVAMGKTAGAKRKVDDKQIYDLAREGKTATEIATILNISKSSVDHSDGWRSRKDNEFAF